MRLSSPFQRLVCALIASFTSSFFISVQSASASPWKCVDVSPVSGPLGYQLRSQGARCEGLYQPSVSSQRIELINLTNAIVTNRGARFIQVGTAASLNNGGVQIVGLSLVPDTFYRLDAPIPPGRQLMVPVADVVEPAALDFSQLGFVGYSGTVIVPLNVQFLDAGQPENIVSSGSMSATISLSTFATDVLWRWKSGCQIAPSNQIWNRVSGGSFFPRSPISFDITPLPTTPCGLEVAVKTTVDGWISTGWMINAVGF